MWTDSCRVRRPGHGQLGPPVRCIVQLQRRGQVPAWETTKAPLKKGRMCTGRNAGKMKASVGIGAEQGCRWGGGRSAGWG